jgi:hypothetical protein
VLVNQVHLCAPVVPDVEGLLGADARALDPATAPMLLARLGAAHRRLRDLAQLEAGRVEELRQAAGRSVWVRSIPRLADEVHDLDGLLALHQHLFEPA